jgi:Immunoglobulin I-set domain
MQIPCQPWIAALHRPAARRLRRPLRLGCAMLVAGALLSGCYVSIGDGVDVGFIDITTQPQDVSATVGSIARFSVGVAGSGNLRFQWRRNGADLANSDRPTYETAPVVLADDGAVFSVQVCNAFSCTGSRGATLTVVQ